MSIQFKEQKPAVLERFGVYYLDLFRKKDLTHHAFDLSDAKLSAVVRRISVKGILLSAFIGLLCVWPTIFISVAGWWQRDTGGFIMDGWELSMAFASSSNSTCFFSSRYMPFMKSVN